MKELSIKEMTSVEGGANPVFVVSAIGVVIAFFIGVFHGYSNPTRCNN